MSMYVLHVYCAPLSSLPPVSLSEEKTGLHAMKSFLRRELNKPHSSHLDKKTAGSSEDQPDHPTFLSTTLNSSGWNIADGAGPYHRHFGLTTSML